jgi:hypothetical protein
VKRNAVATSPLPIERVEFEFIEEFEQLVALEGEGTRLLSQDCDYPWSRTTSRYLGRTLKDILDRMIMKGWSIDSLKQELGDYQRSNETYPLWIHYPQWFSSCFSPSELDAFRFGSLLLKPTTGEELRRSPDALYSIADGCHRALSLAYAVRMGVEYKPVSAYVLNSINHGKH